MKTELTVRPSFLTDRSPGQATVEGITTESFRRARSGCASATRSGTSSKAPGRTEPIAILPPRDDDLLPSARFGRPEAASATEILRCAEKLGIPWKRILTGEIDAEQKLRRYLSDIESHCPLPSLLTILSFSFLQSWRVRDKIERLACQARGASVGSAVRELRTVFQRLTGKGESDRAVFAQHLWFAYQRVLLLNRVGRAAARSRGTMAERLAFICSKARCGYDDAAWAVCQEDLPKPGHRLEAAVRKAREEGFLIPRAETEVRAVIALRRIVRVFPHPRRLRPSAGRLRDPVSLPQRVRLPIGAV